MDTTISPQVRLLALIGLLAAVALAAGMFFLTRSQATSSSAEPLPRLRLQKPAQPVAAKGAAKPARAKPRPKSRPAVAPNGLPTSVADALRRSPVVVVALYAGDAAVDRIARAETQAGARDARAGFVAIDAFDRRRSEALALKTGVLEAPAVLVFRRPDRLAVHIDGFADRLTVAQAAAAAR
jgi:hypothetical protein